MRKFFVAALMALSASSVSAQTSSDPIVGSDFVAQEQNGFVAVEAEHFFSQEKAGVRAFHITTPTQTPEATSDGDDSHWIGASGNAYVEILPDTRRDHGEKLIPGENFSNAPGKLAILNYKVHFDNPGRYYVWARAYSTAAKTTVCTSESMALGPIMANVCNGVTASILGGGKANSEQRKFIAASKMKSTSTFPTAGEHTISFSMREDGFEFDRWLMTTDRDFQRPSDAAGATVLKSGAAPKVEVPFGEDGDGSVKVEASRMWEPVTLSLSGPFAHEQNDLLFPGKPNPFTDMAFQVTFSKGDQSFTVPGYFAADGNAAETSATSGNVWRAHFSPPSAGEWSYSVTFLAGKNVAIDGRALLEGVELAPYNKRKGSFTFNVKGQTKPMRGDQCYTGMLLPQGTHLVYQENGKPFFKVGPDAPETMLAYTDFDDTRTLKWKEGPLKTWKKHVQDSNETDPTWKDGKGKGLLGALNYLGKKGVNSISFLTYNVDGDGSNVWPHVSATDKLHFDCSKLDQWGRVFGHAQFNRLLLHFKLQETENDDWRHGTNKESGKKIAGALDGGKCGPERTLYLRELVARYGHFNMLEWNLGEENTQTFEEQMAMAKTLQGFDAYGHNIVLHTYPQQQDQKYEPWVGKAPLTGLSLQNMWNQVHRRTLHWARKSRESGRLWVLANDEQGQADQGVPPDPGYGDFGGTVTMKNGQTYDLHDIRKQTLWGNLMAGGAGVMYYFGYKLPENDLKAEDFRSRDKSWEYCRIASEFLAEHQLPIHEMQNMNSLVGNTDDSYGPWCLAKPGNVYLVYLPEGGKVTLDLSNEEKDFEAFWFDPEKGGELSTAEVATQKAASEFDAGNPGNDRVLLLRAK